MIFREDVSVPDPRDECFKSRPDDGWALYKRGWTYQELSLSPRVVHFGSQEITWHCYHKDVRESDPSGHLKHLNSSNFVPSLVSINWLDNPTLLHKQWYTVVAAYSWRNLTFRKDTLPAIAAFASRVQSCQPSKRYLAGLWEDTLVNEGSRIDSKRLLPDLVLGVPSVPNQVVSLFQWTRAS
jgi:hypothetical protein